MLTTFSAPRSVCSGITLTSAGNCLRSLLLPTSCRCRPRFSAGPWLPGRAIGWPGKRVWTDSPRNWSLP